TTQGKTISDILQLWPLDYNQEITTKTALDRGPNACFELAKALMNARVTKTRLLHVHRKDPIDCAISGFVKSLRWENPGYNWSVLEIEADLNSPAELVPRLMAELTSDFLDPEVRIDANGRWLPVLRLLAKEDRQISFAKFRDNGVYLITGGTGVLGYQLAEYL